MRTRNDLSCKLFLSIRAVLAGNVGRAATSSIYFILMDQWLALHRPRKFGLELTFYHQPLQLRDGLCGVQSLRADLRAVRDGVAAVEPEWIFEVIETAAR